MEFKWSPFPFLRFTFAFVIGILVSIYFPQSFLTISVFFSLLGIYSLLYFLQKYYFKYTLKPILGFFSFCILFSFGHVLTYQKNETNKINHLYSLNEKGKILAFRGSIIQPIKETKNSLKTTLKVDHVKIDSQWIEVSGNVLCYFQKDSTKTLKYGDKLLIATFFNETENPKNPSEFDYKQYLAYHNIHHRCYAKSDKYKVVGKSKLSWSGSPSIFTLYAQKTRSVLEKKLMQHFKEKREYGIAQALILGVKDDLENDVVKAYSGVGAMHVLAVSGLHVGLVYQVFLILFGWMSSRGWKSGKYLQAIFLLTTIWLYAFVTGLSPSVMRAATMFSFIIIGEATNRETNIYNTLAVSAFFLLCFNPFLVLEVGFQLSYLAVLGIVYIQPKIYRLIDIDNSLLDQIWSITCVSVAAQIGTFPLGLLYFHQFPTFFFISNLVVIPAAVVILYSGMFVLAFSWWEAISETLTFLLENLIWGVNEIIFALNKLPHALLSGIDISILESWLIYAILLFLLLFFHFKRIKFYLIALLLITTVSAFQIHEFVGERGKKEIIFYAVNNHLAIGLRNGEKITFVSDDSLSFNADRMQFHILHHWWKENLSEINALPFENIGDTSQVITTQIEGNKLLIWNGQRFLFYSKPFKNKLNESIHIDYFVIRNNPWIDTKMIEHNISFHNLIIDGSNNWKTSNWVKKCYPNSSIDLKTTGYYLEKL